MRRSQEKATHTNKGKPIKLIDYSVNTVFTAAVALMAELWHYETGNGVAVPKDSLSDLLVSGAITASELVWTQGQDEWQALSLALPELLPSASAPKPKAAAPPLPRRADVSPAARPLSVRPSLPPKPEHLAA